MAKPENPTRVTTANNLAQLIFDRAGQVIPVDVLGLLESRADLVSANWPFGGVDALVLRRPGVRPTVYYRDLGSSPRLRFTLAHELGHLVLPGHLRTTYCAPSGETEPKFVGFGDEDQADHFASCLLAPTRWIEDLLWDYGADMDSVLRDLTRANMSVAAAMLALRRVLMAGWAFRINSQVAPYLSPGTKTTAKVFNRYTATDWANLDRISYDSGTAAFNDSLVSWWRLSPSARLPRADHDPRSDDELLMSAASAGVVSIADARSRAQWANGVVGGATSKVGRRRAAEIHRTLLYKVENQKLEMTSHPDFRRWLRRKALSIEARGLENYPQSS